MGRFKCKKIGPIGFTEYVGIIYQTIIGIQFTGQLYRLIDLGAKFVVRGNARDYNVLECKVGILKLYQRTGRWMENYK